jgi:cytidine deaminase
MKHKNISLYFEEFDTPDKLNPEDLSLLETAKKAALNAYAPYSAFKVGAALRLDSGIVVSGTNVENAAFPSGICAERNVISHAASNYPDNRPVALAIAAFTAEGQTEEPVSPCGNCRQVIAEEEKRNSSAIRIILGGSRMIWVVNNGGDLLPLQFSSDNLRITPRR